MNGSTVADRIAIATEPDIVAARSAARRHAEILRFSVVDTTRLITAVSEIARNTLIHGGGGSMTIVPVSRPPHAGLKIVFRDEGPGIADIAQAMRDGFSTARSLGMGLGGAQRLVSEFEITSTPGRGTTVTLIHWKRT
ncbi:MAG: anti-sigma regulatory factor [Verrucomicrobia bacterium]|nr:MAG: anti-sigma regulatory factor [Verrucomicrobiota bacterium]